MLNNLKAMGLAAAVAVAAPVAATAASVGPGQIGITGVIDFQNSEFTSDGQVTFFSNVGEVQVANGIFSSVDTDTSVVSLTNIDFSDPGQIWSVGGYTFVASSFIDDAFSNSGVFGFGANGTITGDGIEQAGLLSFSTQDTSLFDTNGIVELTFSSTTLTSVPVPAAGLLLIAGLGALGVAGRKKAA